MAYFVDKDGRYHGRTRRTDKTDIEVPGPPRDGRMIWQNGAWQETPETLAAKDAPVQVDRIAALEAALIEKGVLSKSEIDAKAEIIEVAK